MIYLHHIYYKNKNYKNAFFTICRSGGYHGEPDNILLEGKYSYGTSNYHWYVYEQNLHTKPYAPFIDKPYAILLYVECSEKDPTSYVLYNRFCRRYPNSVELGYNETLVAFSDSPDISAEMANMITGSEQHIIVIDLKNDQFTDTFDLETGCAMGDLSPLTKYAGKR